MFSVFNLVLRASLGARPLSGGLVSSATRLVGMPRLAGLAARFSNAPSSYPPTVRMSSEFSDLAQGGGGYGQMNGYHASAVMSPPISNGLGPAVTEEAPSAKQIEYARTLAEKKGIAVPESALSSRRGCSEFIEQHAPAGMVGSAQTGAPTEKQIMFAQRLAAEASIEIPVGTLERADLCATFIEEHIRAADPAGPRRPTEKQLDFASRLAAQRGIAVPEDALLDTRACSAFIDSILTAQSQQAAQAGEAMPMGMRPPSEKQLDFASRLAAQRGIAVPEDALSDTRACSAFIDSILTAQSQQAAQAGGAMAMGMRPPSEKQLEFAAQLAAKANVPVPAEAQQSSAACSAFIESQIGSSKPTEKQLLYAIQLAREARMGIGYAVLVDKAACTAFIESLVTNKQATVNGEAYGTLPATPSLGYAPPYADPRGQSLQAGGSTPSASGYSQSGASQHSFGDDDVDPTTWDMPVRR